MRKIKKNTPGTPSITKEAKLYDGLGSDLQEGIRLAARLNERVQQIERYSSKDIQEEPKQTPVVSIEDIEDEMYR